MSKESRVGEIKLRFRNEVDEHVAAANGLVKQFTQNQSSIDQLIAAARHLHAVKGTAPLVGARAVSEVARTVEECLKAVVANPALFSSLLSRTIGSALELMRQQTVEFADGKPISEGNQIIAALRSLIPSSRLEDDVLSRIASLSPELRNSIGDTQRVVVRREISQNRGLYVLSFAPHNAQDDLTKLRSALSAFGTILSVASTTGGLMQLLIGSDRGGQEIREHLSEFSGTLTEVATTTPEGDAGALIGEVRAPALPEAQGSGSQRILFVDDSAVARDLYRIFLKKNGYDVAVAADGEEAIEKLRAGRYDAIITDDQMPLMDGIELVRHLRDGGSYTRTPVIVISGQVTDAARMRALNAGATAYLIKGDFARDQLLAMVREELEKARTA